jgi:uncharacterized protein YwlG (UPF0340 family)
MRRKLAVLTLVICLTTWGFAPAVGATGVQGGQAEAVSGQAALHDVSTTANPPSGYTTVIDAGDDVGSAAFFNESVDLGAYTGNDSIWIRFEDSNENDSDGVQIQNLTVQGSSGVIADFATDTGTEEQFAFRAVNDSLVNGNRAVNGSSFIVYQFPIRGESTLNLSFAANNEYQVSVRTDAPPPTVDVSSLSINDSTLPENTEVTRTVNFTLTNVSGDNGTLSNRDTHTTNLPSFLNVTSATIDSVTAEGGVDISNTLRADDPRIINDNTSIRFSTNYRGADPTNVSAQVTFTAETPDVNDQRLGSLGQAVIDSDNDFASNQIGLTVQEAGAGIVMVNNATLVPDNVTEGTTEVHELTFNISDVSNDGGTDTINVTLPAGAANITNRNSITVANASDLNQTYSITSSPETVNANGGTNNRITFAISPSDTSQPSNLDLFVTANFTVAFEDGIAPASGPVEASITDSANGEDTDSDDITINAASDATGDVSLSDVSLVPDQADENTVETHTLNFTVSNLSADSANDTINVTLPGVAQFSSLESLTVNGADASGAATLTNNGRSVVVVSNTTGGGAVTANVSATFNASFDNVTGPTGVENVTADATIDVQDSANGSVAGGVPVTVVNTLDSEVTFSDQTSDGTSVVVDSAFLSDGGFVVIHENNNGSVGPVIGVSSYLAPGTSSNVTVTLDSPLNASTSVYAMAHADDGDQTYEFPQSDSPYGDSGFLTAANVTVQNATAPVQVDVFNTTLVPNRVTEGTTEVHELTFSISNVSNDGDTDTINVTLPAGAAQVTSRNEVTIANASDLNQTYSISSSAETVDANGGTNNRITVGISPSSTSEPDNIDLLVTVNFTAAFTDEIGVVTAPVEASIDDSANGFDTDSDDVTVVPPAGEVTLENVSLDPDTVDEGTTNTHTLNFTVTNVSADGVPDTINATVPAGVQLTALESLTLNGQDISGLASVTNGGQTLTATVNPSNGTSVDADVSATFNASFDNVTGPTGVENVTADATIDVQDSANGTVSGAVPVTIVNTLDSEVTFSDQTSDGLSVTVDSAFLSDGGFVVIHENNNGSVGPVIGVSDYLAPGTSSNVTVTLDSPLDASTSVYAMAHADDGDQTYEFPQSDSPYGDSGFLTAANITVDATPEASLTVDTGGQTLNVSETTQVPLVINTTTANGLSGYDLNVTIDDASVVNVTGVSYNTAAFNLTNASVVTTANGTTTVALRAVDLANATGANQTNLTLATLNLTANASGTATFDVDVDQIDDDDGNLVRTTSVPSTLTVQNDTTPIGEDLFPNGVPGSSTGDAPVDVDGDGKLEDIDGNGVFQFVDIIEFVFSQQNNPNAYANLTAQQRAALDFDDNGNVNFVDVIDLVFELQGQQT